MSLGEPVAGFGHVNWEERARFWHRAHDEAARERDLLRADVDRLRREAREDARATLKVIQAIREKAQLCHDCDCRLDDNPCTISVRGKAFACCARCAVIRARGTMTAVLLEGERFDWEAAKEIAGRVVTADGEVNWGAAACADPGVMACPACGVYHWREGTLVRCGNCSHEWRP